MADFGGFASGAAGGAMAGMSIGGPWGAAIGGLVGGIGSLFGDSPEEQRKKNRDAQIAANFTNRVNLERTGFTRLGGQVARNMSAARQAASRRAAALGRTGAVEAFVAPAEGRAQEAGGQAISSYMEGIDRTFAMADINAEQQFASRDVSPGVGETIGALGGGISQFMQNKDYINTLKGMGTAEDLSVFGSMEKAPYKKPSLSSYNFDPIPE